MFREYMVVEAIWRASVATELWVAFTLNNLASDVRLARYDTSFAHEQ